MTKEEILAMKPGRELDALVAEHLFKIHTETKNFRCSNGERTWTFEHKATFPNYSTDISAAWEIKGKLPGYFGVTYCHGRVNTAEEEANWFWLANASKNDEIYSARGETAPEGICKAALLACLEGK